MRKSRRITALAGASAALIALAGCSSSSPTDSGETADGGTITFGAQVQEQGVWEPLIAAFEEANPGYTVKATFTPNDQFPQLIQTQFQSGQAPDVIQVTPGSGGGLAGLTLADGGRLAPLDDQAWVEDLPEALAPLVTLDEHIYTLPTAIAPYFVAYNPDLFDEVGVEVPETFGDLLDACGDITAAGYIPVALAGASFNNVTITLAALAANDVDGPDPGWGESRAAGDTTFADSAEWNKVLSDFQEMKDAGCFADDVAAINAPVHSQQFGSGQAAMYVMPAQALSIVAENSTPDLKVSTFPFPADKAEDTRISSSSGIGLVVNAEAKDMAAAQKFTEFLGSREQRIAYADTAGGIAWAAGENGEDVIPEVLEPLRDVLADHAVTPGYVLWPNASIQQQMSTSAQGLLTGQKSIEQVLADTDNAWDAASK